MNFSGFLIVCFWVFSEVPFCCYFFIVRTKSEFVQSTYFDPEQKPMNGDPTQKSAITKNNKEIDAESPDASTCVKNRPLEIGANSIKFF